ncbi:MAG: hypothetical protein ACK6D2_09255, partial [Planctomycetota bacterium]
MRLGALLALARRGDAAVARFLADADPDLRADAARAIHDTPIPAAMQALAKLAYDDAPDREAVDWRAINANRAVGMSENGEALVHLAALPSHAERMRVEALDVLGEWLDPHGQCRVTGNWRPCQHPGGDVVKQSFFGSLPQLLADPVVAAAACRAAAKLGLQQAGPALDGIGKKLTRAQLLEALVAPSARIAEGSGTTTVRLHDGTMHAGVVTKDQDGEVVVAPANGDPVRIPATAIASRTP